MVYNGKENVIKGGGSSSNVNTMFMFLVVSSIPQYTTSSSPTSITNY